MEKCKNSNYKKILVFTQKSRFHNKNLYISKIDVLHYSLYLGQFLDYIDPLYHFGIVKVCTLSMQIDKSIIMVIRNTIK